MAVEWDSQTVLVTGGTGSFGRRFAEVMVREYPVGKLIIFSRDEYEHDQILNLPTFPAMADRDVDGVAAAMFTVWNAHN